SPPSPRRSTSKRATSGAPWPPAATSALRRSDRTGSPVRSAIQAGRPIWSVPATRPSGSTQWKTVWPWATTRAASGWRSAARAAAAANSRPTAVSSRQTASIVVWLGGRADRNAAASPSEYGVVSWPSGVSRRTWPSRSRSAEAASMPSIDVPDMSPTTITGAQPLFRPAPRRSRGGQGLADHAVGGGQAPPGLGRVDAGQEGDDGRLHLAAGGVEGGGGLGRRAGGGGGDDPPGPVDELLAAGPDVDHEVPERPAEPDHHHGRDRVEDELLGRAGLEPGGSGDDLGADDDLDGVVGGGRDERTRLAGQPDGEGARLPGGGEGAEHVGGASAGADADDGVGRADAEGPELGGAGGGVVLGALLGRGEGAGAAGHQGDDLVGGVEGRAALGGVEHAHAAGGAGADVDDPPVGPVGEAGDDGVDGGGDGGGGPPDGGGDGRLLRGHQPDELLRRPQVEIGQLRPDLLGDEATQVAPAFGRCQILGSGHGRSEEGRSGQGLAE